MNLQDKLIKLYNEIDELKNKKSSSDSDFKAWRTDVQLCLSGLYGEKSIQLKNFNNRPFSPMVIVGNTDFHEPYVRDLETTKKEFERYIGDFEDVSTNTNVKKHISVNNKVFIVHGHDGELKEKVARRLEQQGIEAIILSEQANRGKTIIEKIEAFQMYMWQLRYLHKMILEWLRKKKETKNIGLGRMSFLKQAILWDI